MGLDIVRNSRFIKIIGIFIVCLFLSGNQFIPGGVRVSVNAYHRPDENPFPTLSAGGEVTNCGMLAGNTYKFGELSFTVSTLRLLPPKFVLEWSDFGGGDTWGNYPRSVAAHPEGFIYVADVNNYHISKFTDDGIFLLNY